MWVRSVVLLTALGAVACGQQSVQRIYIGTYTGLGSKGIYQIDFDPASGRFTSQPTLAVETENPSFLAASPDGRFVFAVNELWRFKNERTGAVSAFRVDSSTGTLSSINQQPSVGINPCFIVVDAAGRHALVANYTDGTLSVLPIDNDGRLSPASMVRGATGSGPVRDRQEGPHAHHAVFDPSGRFALWTNLGGDWVSVDRYDAPSGHLEPATPPGVQITAGSGPRHLAWHPSGRALYLLNELTSTVTQLAFDSASGALTVGKTIDTRAAGTTATNAAAEIAVSSDGKFVYTSNRGDDAIVTFSVAPNTLELTRTAQVPSGGQTPRHFAIDPSGRWLIAANQGSSSLNVFRIDPATGALTATDISATVSSPSQVLFFPAKKR